MKLSLREMVGKRSFPASFWIIFLAVSGFVILIAANLLLWQSQIGQVAWLLAKVTLHILPPFIWLAGGSTVVLWLVVLNWLWLPQSITASRCLAKQNRLFSPEAPDFS